jgi:hypothetical protein
LRCVAGHVSRARGGAQDHGKKLDAWLKASDLTKLSSVFTPGAVPDKSRFAVTAWNLMGGLDWAALPTVVELLGVVDVESLVRQLISIRDHHLRQAGA